VAQNSLTGKVTDFNAHSPIIVPLSTSRIKEGASTKSDGVYTIDRFRRGRFFGEIKFIGYSSVIQSVQMNGAPT